MSTSSLLCLVISILINHGSSYDGETYNCEDRNPCTEENSQNGSYYFPHDDVTKFVQCSHWQQCFIMQCPNRTIWNPEVVACDHDNRPQTTPEVETPAEVKHHDYPGRLIREVTEIVPTQSPDEQVTEEVPDQEPEAYNCEDKNPCTEENADEGLYYFPHEDLTKFVQCGVQGQCFVQSCPPGTIWDSQFTTCVHGNRPATTTAPEDEEEYQTTISPFSSKKFSRKTRFPRLPSF